MKSLDLKIAIVTAVFVGQIGFCSDSDRGSPMAADLAVGQPDELGGEGPDVLLPAGAMIDIQPETRLLTDIAIGVEQSDEADPGAGLFDRHEENQTEAVRREIDSLMKEGAFQTRIGNYAGAIKAYDKIIEMDPENNLTRFNRGTALVQSERYEEALEELLLIMDKNPGNFMIKNNVAWIYATADDIKIRNGQKARSLARDALLLAPGDFHVWNTLSEAYFVSAHYEKALKLAEISLRLAVEAGQSDEKIENFAEQLRKCRQAVATMSIME